MTPLGLLRDGCNTFPGILLAVFASSACLAESPTSSEPDHTALIESLDAASFASRRQATQKLESLGKQVYPALADAAIERDHETTQRVLAILEVGLKQSDSVTKEAAKKELQRIASSKNRSAARAAQELISTAGRSNRVLTPAELGVLLRAQRVARPAFMPPRVPRRRPVPPR